MDPVRVKHMRKPRPRRPAPVVDVHPAVGVLLDLENLLHDTRLVSGDAVRAGFRTIMDTVRSLGTARFAVGVCDWWLAKILSTDAHELGLRVFPGEIGPDRADAELIRRGERDLPPSVDLVVIGSGDHAFADLARVQHDAGRQVVVLGRPGHIARELTVVADEVLVIELDAFTPTAA